MLFLDGHLPAGIVERTDGADDHRDRLAESLQHDFRRRRVRVGEFERPVADITVARDAGSVDIEAAVLALDAMRRALDGKAPKKVIVVPQRIVNVVA